MKKKGNELLYGSFFVLKLSIVAFRPQATHKTTRECYSAKYRCFPKYWECYSATQCIRKHFSFPIIILIQNISPLISFLFLPFIGDCIEIL
jgi:hypothetical protein